MTKIGWLDADFHEYKIFIGDKTFHEYINKQFPELFLSWNGSEYATECKIIFASEPDGFVQYKRPESESKTYKTYGKVYIVRIS